MTCPETNPRSSAQYSICENPLPAGRHGAPAPTKSARNSRYQNYLSLIEKSNQFIPMLTRREFIHKSAAAVALALTATPRLTHATASIKTVGVQLWSIAKFLEKDFKGSLKLLSSIGYKEL